MSNMTTISSRNLLLVDDGVSNDCIICAVHGDTSLVVGERSNVPVQARRRVSADVAWNRWLGAVFILTDHTCLVSPENTEVVALWHLGSPRT